MKQNNKKHFKFKIAQIIPLGFLGLILFGALLLMTPMATASGEGTDFSTALFTSTTSVCVTGSVVVDTYSYWSLFGQIIILILIQLGGLGIVAVVSLVVVSARRKKSLVMMMLLRDSFNLDSMHGVAPFISRVFIGTLTVEGLGAIGYFFAFIPEFGVIRGIWYSFFTSVSAFCNAGIDIIGPDSLARYSGKPLVLIVTMFLIIAGGIGYVVWFDLGYTSRKIWRRKKNPHGSSEHTKVVLFMTSSLILVGAVYILLLERDNAATIGNMPMWKKMLNATFQSVTYRTAGFSTFPQESLRESTTIVGDILMFIGGSPVGTAGGVKTVTIYLLVKNVDAFARSDYHPLSFGRRIPDDLIRKATAIVLIHLSYAIFMTLALMIVEDISFIDAMYEIMSGLSTVGVSRGLTPNLHLGGRIILIFTMYLGRIGPISMGLFFNNGSKKDVKPAKGRFIVG